MATGRPSSHLTSIRSGDGVVRPTWASTGALMHHYYDLFESLCLQTFQAGMSWEVVLRKRPALRELFADFDPEAVAGFTDDDIDHVLADPRGIRNIGKIGAVITNAARTLALRQEGGLAAFVWSFTPPTPPRIHALEDVPAETPESRLLAKALRRRGFRYVGPRNMFALMQAAGIVDTRVPPTAQPTGAGEPTEPVALAVTGAEPRDTGATRDPGSRRPRPSLP